MDKEAYENMVIRSNLNDLKKYIDTDNLWTAWGGNFEFDIPAYIAWRGAEEGVEVGGMVPRRFDPSTNKNDAIGDTFATMSSKAMSTFDPPPTKVRTGHAPAYVLMYVWGYGDLLYSHAHTHTRAHTHTHTHTRTHTHSHAHTAIPLQWE